MCAWAKAEFADVEKRDLARAEIKTKGGLTTAEAIAYLEGIAAR